MEIRFNIDGRWYEWVGGFGAIIVSYEREVKKGDVRIIDDELFYIYSVHSGGFCGKPSVQWTMPKISNEEIRRIKKKWFS